MIHQIQNQRLSEYPTTQPGRSESALTNQRKCAEFEKDDIASSVREDFPWESSTRDRANTILTTGSHEHDPSSNAMIGRDVPPPGPENALTKPLQQELATAQENQSSVLPGAQISQKHAPAAQDNPQYVSIVEKSVSPADESCSNRQTLPYQSELSQNDSTQSPKNKKRSRKFCNRTKTGCHTCRARKKKCDENKPVCENCQRGLLNCGGYGPKPPGRTDVGARQSLNAIKPAYDPPHLFHGNRPQQSPYYPSDYVSQVPFWSNPYATGYRIHPEVLPPAVRSPGDTYAMQYAEIPHSPYRSHPYIMSPPSLPVAEFGASGPHRFSSDTSHGSHRQIAHDPSAPCVHLTLPSLMDHNDGSSGHPVTTNSTNNGTSSHYMEAHGTMRSTANEPGIVVNRHNSHLFHASHEQRSRDSFEPTIPHTGTLDGYVVREQVSRHPTVVPQRCSPNTLPIPRTIRDDTISRSSHSIRVPLQISDHDRHVWQSNQEDQVSPQFIDIGATEVASKITIRYGQLVLRMRSLKQISAVMTNELKSDFDNLPDMEALHRNLDHASQRAQHFAKQADVAQKEVETCRQDLEHAHDVANRISDTEAKLHRILRDIEAIRALLAID